MAENSDSSSGSDARDDERWARHTLGSLLEADLAEKRRARRWKIFYRLLIIGVIVILAAPFTTTEKMQAIPFEKHAALVKLDGPILEGTPASANNIIGAIRKAYKNENSQAIILQINSPGGSPVQSAQISDEIIRLRAKHSEKPCYAVISDVGASGAYYVAAAADAIYANQASLIGSIGVILNSFGMVETIKMLGIERRSQKAGIYKDMLDPFSPSSTTVEAHLQKMLEQIHQQFISRVKQGRGNKLSDTPTLFSGLIWTGEEAKTLGLIDNFASVEQVAREVVGTEKVVEYAPEKDFIDQFINRLGAYIGNVLVWRMWSPSLS